MKSTIIKLSVISLSLALGSLPAVAQVIGPRGGTASGNRIVRPNRAGGTTRVEGWTGTGPQGGTSAGTYGVRTDGQGNVIYGRGRSTTGPNGQTRTIKVTGSGSYDPASGYTGQGSRTMNGETYTTTTQNGATTVTGPEGNSKTFFRRR